MTALKRIPLSSPDYRFRLSPSKRPSDIQHFQEHQRLPTKRPMETQSTLKKDNL